MSDSSYEILWYMPNVRVSRGLHDFVAGTLVLRA
jgi:hypothetical protein